MRQLYSSGLLCFDFWTVWEHCQLFTWFALRWPCAVYWMLKFPKTMWLTYVSSQLTVRPSLQSELSIYRDLGLIVSLPPPPPTPSPPTHVATSLLQTSRNRRFCFVLPLVFAWSSIWRPDAYDRSCCKWGWTSVLSLCSCIGVCTPLPLSVHQYWLTGRERPNYLLTYLPYNNTDLTLDVQKSQLCAQAYNCSPRDYTANLFSLNTFLLKGELE